MSSIHHPLKEGLLRSIHHPFIIFPWLFKFRSFFSLGSKELSLGEPFGTKEGFLGFQGAFFGFQGAFFGRTLWH